MKVALIGTAGHKEYVLTGIRAYPGAQLTAFAPDSRLDGSEDFRWKLHEQFQTRFFDDWRTMLDEARPDVLAVAGRTGNNGEIVLEAVQRGIHVFAEKPLCSEMSCLTNIRKAYQKGKVHLAAMHAYRYDPVFCAAYEAITAGKIGIPALVTAQKSYKRGADLERRGHTIPWVGAHAVDWAVWMTGKKCVSVFASQSRLGNLNSTDCEAVASALLSMEGGAEAVIHLDYLRPEATAGHGDDRLRIAGTTGIVEVSHGISWLNTGGTWSELELYPPSRPMFADFLAQIEGRGSCKVTASDSFHITECCLQAQRSAESGIPIKIGLGGG